MDIIISKVQTLDLIFHENAHGLIVNQDQKGI
jgi:hypothetical protein